MLKITILLLGLFWCLRLWIEGRDAAKSRATLRHVVHVNGTRGKSTVCRLIEAGLRAGGLRVFRSEERRVGKECRSRWSPYH